MNALKEKITHHTSHDQDHTKDFSGPFRHTSKTKRAIEFFRRLRDNAPWRREPQKQEPRQKKEPKQEQGQTLSSKMKETLRKAVLRTAIFLSTGSSYNSIKTATSFALTVGLCLYPLIAQPGTFITVVSHALAVPFACRTIVGLPIYKTIVEMAKSFKENYKSLVVPFVCQAVIRSPIYKAIVEIVKVLKEKYKS